MNADEIRDYFSKDLFAVEAAGIEILDFHKDYARTRLLIKPIHRNANNVVMGGCIYTLADFTFAVAANTENPQTTTLSSDIIFNAPAPGDVLYAETEMIKSGRTIASFIVKVTDENDRLIATATVLGFRKS